MEFDSSQVDIMATQLPNSQVVSTQQSQTNHQYNQVVMFHWNKVKVKGQPFVVHQLENFEKDELPNDWFQFQMRASSRSKKMKPISSFQNESLSMFAKVEEGCIFIIINYCFLFNIIII